MGLALLAGCRDDSRLMEGEAVLGEVRRAAIETRSLGRFGIYALMLEELDGIPCAVPLSDSNRICDVHLVGRGDIRLVTADRALEQSNSVNRNALVRVEYGADCGNQGFDFKTFDQVLPRRAAASGVTKWASDRVELVHSRTGEGAGAQCRVVVGLGEPLLMRIRAGIPAR